jgi:hypothetical protein
MHIDDLEARVRGLEARVAKLEAQLRGSTPKPQPKRAEVPDRPPVSEPQVDLGQDLAAEIGRNFTEAASKLEW